MAHLDLDPATFRTAARFVDAAAAQLAAGPLLDVPAGAAGHPGLAAALADLHRAWAADVAWQDEELRRLAAALGAAGSVFADAERRSTAGLVALLAAPAPSVGQSAP